MRLREFAEQDADIAKPYDPSEDRLNARHYGDTRKPKLTLRHINKLRKMRESKKLQMLQREKSWKTMYGLPEPEPGMEGPAGPMPEF